MKIATSAIAIVLFLTARARAQCGYGDTLQEALRDCRGAAITVYFAEQNSNGRGLISAQGTVAFAGADHVAISQPAIPPLKTTIVMVPYSHILYVDTRTNCPYACAYGLRLHIPSK